MIFSILFITLALVCIWLILDFQYGRKRHVKKHKHLTFPQRKSDFSFYADGTDLFEDLFNEIKSATDHIHVLFYIVQNDAFSQKFLQLLVEKASEGVEVRLLLDWVGNLGFKKKFIKRLKKHNVQFAFSHVPRLPFLFYSLQERNHRKITVVDGKIGYIGGFNIGKEYIGGNPKLSPWRDYHLKVTGEGVQDLQQQFLMDWNEASKEEVKGERYYPSLPTGSVLHQFSAADGTELEQTFIDFIQATEKSLYIGSPYFIPSPALFSTLLNLLERGVEITIVVPKNSDHPLVQEASYRYFRTLLKKGATIYQFENGFYHSKIIIRDDLTCDVGTANFDKRSLFLNHELNCFIHDSSFALEAKGQLLQDIAQSIELSASQLNKLNPFRSFKEMLARFISHFL